MKTRERRNRNLNQFYCLILILSAAINAMPVLGQTRRTRTNPGNQPVAANQTKQKTPTCAGAWTGVIDYTRSQANSNHKVVSRVSGRGEDTTDWNMEYNYKATVAVIEAPEKNGSSLGRASINHSMSSIEKI